jgi:hypothetical protein
MEELCYMKERLVYLGYQADVQFALVECYLAETKKPIDNEMSRQLAGF